MIERECRYCGNRFKTYAAWIRQGGGKFCSPSCAAKYHRDNMDCGYVTMFKPGHPQLNTGRTRFTSDRLRGRKHSFDHVQKVRAALTGVPRPNRRGENSSNWKGGITGENKLARTSAPFLIWRKKVFENDDWTCQVCGVRGGRLHAHHIRMFSKYPKIRFDPSNGVTVCENCHRLADDAARLIYVLEGGYYEQRVG